MNAFALLKHTALKGGGVLILLLLGGMGCALALMLSTGGFMGVNKASHDSYMAMTKAMHRSITPADGQAGLLLWSQDLVGSFTIVKTGVSRLGGLSVALPTFTSAIWVPYNKVNQAINENAGQKNVSRLRAFIYQWPKAVQASLYACVILHGDKQKVIQRNKSERTSLVLNQLNVSVLLNGVQVRPEVLAAIVGVKDYTG
jgi:hypothetical protein